jgi:hypothetical protein
VTGEASLGDGEKRMRLRYAGACVLCGTALERGASAVYSRITRTVRCLDCRSERPAPTAGPSELSVVDGAAGASARREFDRRHTARQERVRARAPRIGGLLLALFDDPQSTRAWDTGARGEEHVGRALDAAAGPTFRVLHDRRVPRSRANLDHVVVCASGVVVIDAKRYKGRPRHVVEGGFLRPRVDKLLVGTRDCTRLVTAVRGQVEVVRTALGPDLSVDVDVTGALCFVEADWPLIGGSFVIDGVAVTWPRRLATVLGRAGPLDADTIADLHRRLASALPPA